MNKELELYLEAAYLYYIRPELDITLMIVSLRNH